MVLTTDLHSNYDNSNLSELLQYELNVVDPIKGSENEYSTKNTSYSYLALQYIKCGE